MKIKEIIHALEEWASPSLQESYDNSGFLVGEREKEVTGVLISLDTTEKVIDEAIQQECNLIISHHPLIFQGIKKLTNEHWVQRCISKAIKNDINLYAIHTNLDQVNTGVNSKIANKMGLVHARILQPKAQTLSKLVTYLPESHLEAVRSSLFAAGAGAFGKYEACSFTSSGFGTFVPKEGAQPYIGQIGLRHTEPEVKLEVLVPNMRQYAVIQALLSSHPYEEVAYELYLLSNSSREIGSGMIGLLPESLSVQDFLEMLHKKFQTGSIRYSGNYESPIRTVALCGGSGFFLLRQAIEQKADAFVTADLKYHDFFEAENHLLLADIGHYESEAGTKELIGEFLNKNFANIAVRLSDINTNPIQYF